ncbi:MAG TPA: carboxypeptidase-like regulatory domain-containing protein, partial [Pyrinomonadaceae bacterium]|nr:carboxypeptidase-like regulatory domain-containing protein [Pyrinomonadaceae bacterium]
TVVVTGRVVYEDTGQPVTRHRVQLIPSEALLNGRSGLRLPTAITDERGEFSLRQIIAGEYYVLAGPVDQRGNQQLTSILTRSGDSAADAAKLDQFKKKNLRITVDGQRNVEVNLRVPNPHFGTISGIVFDAAHQPMAGATVHVVSKGNDSFGESVHTDDQGRYKVWGLPKGEYTVSASPPSKPRSDGKKPVEFQGSPGATYFPSTLLLRNSPAVAVLPDLDTANVDVTLISRALRNLAGTVRMKGDNRPITNAALRLSVKQITDPATDPSSAVAEQPLSNYLSSTDKDGRWSFSNVPDGSYRLFVQTKQGREPTEPRFVDMEQDLTVDGSDVEDLVIEVSGGARLSGVVILEGSSATPQDITVAATSYTPPANAAIVLEEVGKFVLTAAPVGEIDVSAFPSPQDQFYVKSIEANGRDLLRNRLTLASGDEIKDVRIVVSAGVGVITGRVLSQTGDKPVAGVDLMLRRTGDDKLRLFGGKLTATTDNRGAFTLSAAPGTYLVVAWRSADGPGAFANAMNKATREQGTGIKLSANDRKEINIRLP